MCLTLSWWGRGIMQIYSPGLSDVLQQQVADVPMGQCIPVDAVGHAVLQVGAEVEVQVEDVQTVGVCQPTAVEVCFNYVIAKRGTQVAHLLGFSDVMIQPTLVS